MPQTSLYLIPLNPIHGKCEPGGLKKISREKGYNNQPSFSKSGGKIYFVTSVKEGGTDVVEYGLKKNSWFVFKSPQTSEYSPMETADGKGVSVVRVEKDSTQRIWVIYRNGKPDFCPAPFADSIGYYAFAGKDTLLAFIISNPPNTGWFSISSGKEAWHNSGFGITGRSFTSLHSLIPGMVLLTRSLNDSVRVFEVRNFKGELAGPVFRFPGTGQDFAMSKGGEIFVGYGSRILKAKPDFSRNEFMGVDWIEIGDFSKQGIKNISRLAISPDGKNLVFVDIEN